MNAAFVIDTWLFSSALFAAMNDGGQQITLYLITQVPLTLSDEMKEAMFYTFPKLQLLFDFTQNPESMWNFTPFWKSSISD